MPPLRTNPELLNLTNINDLVIPPPLEYHYFEDADNHPFEGQIGKYSETDAWWMAEFSTLIYEKEEKVREEIGKLTNNELIWLSDTGTNTEGFFAKFKDYCVVSFRGTELLRPTQILDPEESKDFLSDVLLTDAKIQGSDLRGVKVHKGILDALNSVWEELLPILENEDKPIWFTGHSLGGALALMAAFKWQGNQTKIGGVYTIGGPAIGSPEFKQQYNNELGNKTFQHIYGEDIITKIGQIAGAAPGIMDFQQVGEIINISRSDVSFFENLALLMQMPLIDHGPIFYLNHLWNQIHNQVKQ